MDIIEQEANYFAMCLLMPEQFVRVVARAPIGVSDEAMTGAWRVIIARVPDRYVTYYYHENDDARLRLALRAQAERWVASHLERRKR